MLRTKELGAECFAHATELRLYLDMRANTAGRPGVDKVGGALAISWQTGWGMLSKQTCQGSNNAHAHANAQNTADEDLQLSPSGMTVWLVEPQSRHASLVRKA